VTLRRALLEANTRDNVALALKTALAARGLDARLSRAAARLALAQPGLDPESRSQAEELLAAERAAVGLAPSGAGS
jgi:hypothetical protein